MLRVALLCSMTLAAGCGIHPTPAMQKNAAAITDAAKDIDNTGALPKSQQTQQLVKNAVTNEGILGSPEERIPSRDYKAQEENRTRAEADAKAGGFWFIAGSAALGVGALLAGWFGFGGIATWLRKRADDLMVAKEKADTYERKAESYVETLGTTVAAIQDYIERHPTETETLLNTIRQKARDSDQGKATFDQIIRSVK